MSSSASNRALRHSATVRATYWIIAIATIALIVSGVAILLAHPRLSWGKPVRLAHQPSSIYRSHFCWVILAGAGI